MVNRTTPDKDPLRAPARRPVEAQHIDQDEMLDGQEAGDLPTSDDESEASLGEETGFDRIVGAEEAGLGGGLDQAEEAQLGITDEELAEMARTGRKPPKK